MTPKGKEREGQAAQSLFIGNSGSQPKRHLHNREEERDPFRELFFSGLESSK